MFRLFHFEKERINGDGNLLSKRSISEKSVRVPVNKSLKDNPGKEIGFIGEVAGRENSIEIFPVRDNMIIVTQVRTEHERGISG